jgi:predicted dehydrogenase
MKRQHHPQFTRRNFLKSAAAAAGAIAVPNVIPPSVLGLDGTVAPSERIVLGAIGIGGRGTYVLGCFLEEEDVQFVAIAEVKAARRQAVKEKADAKYGNTNCVTYRDLRELLARPDIDAVLIATGPNWHALASITAAKAGKDVYCEKPCSKNIADSFALADAFRRTGRVFQAGTQRRSLPNFEFAAELALRGRLGKLTALHAHPNPGGMPIGSSGWLEPEPEPSKEEGDWDLYLGPAAWRPFNKAMFTRGGSFEKGGGMVGGGCLEWGSHCVDLCQWANDADRTAAVEYWPQDGQLHARYANGVKLVVRNTGWLPNIGSCPARYEGEKGWVETGDSGDVYTSSPELLAGRRAKIAGYPANFHVRNFLDCVKSRGKTRADAETACWSHVTCHAGNIALFLDRKVTFDVKRREFVGDEEANRLRSEALREPWRM